MRIAIVLALLAVCAVNVASQQLPVQSRAHTIAAAFNKQKQGVKAKLGVPREKFKDIKTEPVVAQDLRDHSGIYAVPELGFVIEIQVASDGRAQGSGHEEGESNRTFRFENAKVEGAVLTATKVYGDGSKEKFEGAFLSRTIQNSPAAQAQTTFGLGVLLTTPLEVNGLTYDKLFFELKR